MLTTNSFFGRVKIPLIFVTVVGMVFLCVVYSETILNKPPSLQGIALPVKTLSTSPLQASAVVRSVEDKQICAPSSTNGYRQCGPIAKVAGALTLPYKVQFVHQSWKVAKLPSRFKKWSDSWKRCFPNAQHILWTDEDNRRFIAQYYPWFLKRYDTLPSHINRADAVRYFYLFHFGGIYTDLDNECLRPFDHLLLNSTMVFGAMAGYNNVKEGYVQNSFMYSTARHPMWLELAFQIMNSPLQNIAPENLAGPGALVTIINAYRKRMNSTEDITVYPPHYFNPFSWQRNKVKACKHFNHMSDAELIQCREAHRNTSYVIQYHTHTWGGGKVL